ncbi:MAG: PD-(D/E)XK nuclease family protein [Thermomicrobiales bacterium]
MNQADRVEDAAEDGEIINAAQEPAALLHDRRALEAFVVENADLEALEGLLDQFNIFETVGVIRQELRHSDFLAFLLDPRQNHRLGDAFVQRLLQKVLIATRHLAPPLSPVHLDSWDLGRITVRREWQNINILLVDPVNRLVVVIENKIDSGEHSGQLAKYLRIVQNDYPVAEWRHLAVYLTPDGADPSDAGYLPADYGLVADAVEAVATSREPSIDPAVHQLMIHYARMLRRHIVTDSEIADLCRRIFQKHQRALDLIFEHRPDRLAEVHAILLDLVGSRDDLILDTSPKQSVRFGHADWEGLPKGDGWTRSARLVLFQFDNNPESVNLALWVGPGPAEVRQKLIELATAHQPPYRVLQRTAFKNQKWQLIYSRPFLLKEDFGNATRSEIEAQIREKWEQFVNQDLLPLVTPIQEVSSSLETLLD